METLQDSEGNNQKPIEQLGYSELNTAGWNAYFERDEETLAEVAAEAEARRILQESAAAGGFQLQDGNYTTLSRSLYKDLGNLRTYLKRSKNG